LAAQARGIFRTIGDLLAAWREYRQVAATFDAIADIAALRSAADLGKAKAVREAIKREKNDFEEQERLGGEVLAAFSGTESDDSSPAESADRAISRARDLRLRAANEKKPDRALVFRRALAGVFVAAMESGSDALDKKGYRQAARQFACAAEANPESEWAFRNLAVAQALGAWMYRKLCVPLRTSPKTPQVSPDEQGGASLRPRDRTVRAIRLLPLTLGRVCPPIS
jgi:hypothetical protein